MTHSSRTPENLSTSDGPRSSKTPADHRSPRPRQTPAHGRSLAHRQSLALGAALVAAGLVLTACGSDDSGSADGSGASATPSATGTPSSGASVTPETSTPAETPTADPTPTDTAGGGVGSGCPATDGGVPEGASTMQVVDVDGDDQPDTAWLTGGADRTVGITTASGATFSAKVESASPVAASAVVGTVGEDVVPIVLVDLGREAQVFSLEGCAVTQTVDQEGAPYVFDRGFGDQGTGVGCSDIDGVQHLAGLLATEEGDGWTVTRTLVDLSDGGRVATNGTVEVVAQGAAATDPVVTTAQEVSCGDAVAGPGALTEPES